MPCPSSSLFGPGSSNNISPGAPRGFGGFPTGSSSAGTGRSTLAGFLSYVFAPPREDPAFDEHSAGASGDEWGVLGTKLESESFRTE